VWDRLKNHPELTRIETGDALNFLLNRLSSTALSYEFVRRSGDFEEGMLKEFQLAPEQLHGLQLVQITGGGQQLVFRADGGSGLDLEWWPYLLRWDQFAAERSAFEDARAAVLADADGGGEIRVDNLQGLERALGELVLRFYNELDREDWRKATYTKRSQYRAAEAFLSRLDREIVRIQNVGDVEAFRVRGGYDPAHDGDHLIGLLTYMTRNGVQFDRAAPGDEPVYHTVFMMMRDLYVTVAEQDEGIRPKSLGEQFN
jgi:hypothetical protein